jgi:CcmD family protein
LTERKTLSPRELEFVSYGLAAAWAVVVAYVLFMEVRGRKLRKELDRVRRMVEGSGKK